MGLVRRVVNRVLNPEQAKIGKKNFAGSLWDRLHGLDCVFDDCEGSSVLDIGSYEALISYECVRRGARLAHAFERDRERVLFAKRLFRDVPVENEMVAADIAISGREFEDRFKDLLLPSYDIVLFLGIYHHLQRQMAEEDLADLVRFLLERTGKWLAVRTFEDAALDATIQAAGLQRVESVEGIEEQRGSLVIYRR